MPVNTKYKYNTTRNKRVRASGTNPNRLEGDQLSRRRRRRRSANASSDYQSCSCPSNTIHTIPYNAMQHHVTPYLAMQYQAMSYNTNAYNASSDYQSCSCPSNTIHYTIPYNAMQYIAISFNTKQCQQQLPILRPNLAALFSDALQCTAVKSNQCNCLAMSFLF